MKKVLSAAWHPGSANAIAPVINNLDGEIDIVNIAHEYSKEIFEDYGIEYETLDSYGISEPNPEVMENLIEQESPDLVLTGTSPQSEGKRYVIEQTLTEAAKRKGISSLAVLDFWGNYYERFSDEYDDSELKYLPETIAVMDELAEEGMMDAGINKSNIEITGNPYFDDLAEMKERFDGTERKRVRKDCNIAEDDYMAMFASQPIAKNDTDYGYTQLDALGELLNTAEKMSEDISVLVKSHPREDLDALIKKSEEYDVTTKFKDDYPIRDLIMAGDYTFSMFSTVLVEASYLDKPAISIQPSLNNKEQDPLITNQLGVTIPIYNEGERTEQVLNGLIKEDGYFEQEAPNQHQFSTDGNATQRVVDLVKGKLADC